MPVISRSARTIFVHIPKTAGTAVSMYFYQRGLVDDADWENWYRHNDHKPARFLRDQLNAHSACGQQWQDFRAFTIVRNPFDRMISYWHYKQRSWSQRLHDEARRLAFPEFVDHCLNGGTYEFPDQYSWIADESGESMVERVLRLDTLADDWLPLCREFGLPAEPLAEMNRTHGPNYDHGAYYTSDARAMVEAAFARDFDKFQFDYRPGKASTARATSRIVQLCPTLGTFCGIATYAEMLAEAKEQATARELDDIDFGSIDVLHLQHESSLVPSDWLASIIQRCRDEKVALVVTMHRVERSDLRVLVSLYAGALKRKLARATQTRARDAGNEGGLDAPAVGPPAHAPSLLTRAVHIATEFFRKRRQQRDIVKYARTVVVHSQEARSELLRHGPADVRVVAHPLKKFPVSAHLRSDEDGQLHVGYFGFLRADKDLIKLVQACATLDNVRLHLLACIPHQHGGIATDTDHIVQWLREIPWIEMDMRFLALDEVVLQLSRNDVNVYLTTAAADGFSTSGSIRQYLAAQRPIVTNRSVMTSDLEGVITVLPDTRLTTIASHIRDRDEDVSRIRNYCEKFTWSQMPDVYSPDGDRDAR